MNKQKLPAPNKGDVIVINGDRSEAPCVFTGTGTLEYADASHPDNGKKGWFFCDVGNPKKRFGLSVEAVERRGYIHKTACHPDNKYLRRYIQNRFLDWHAESSDA